jgi:hypothetical protein
VVWNAQEAKQFFTDQPLTEDLVSYTSLDSTT